MIENVTIRKYSIDERPMFEVGYFDLAMNDDKSYCWSARYGTETQMRELLRSHGVPDKEIDEDFDTAKR